MRTQILSLRDRFAEAMEDDFNTARALGHVFDAVRLINGYLAEGKTPFPAEKRFVIGEAKALLGELGGVLGLFQDDPDAYFEKDRFRRARNAASMNRKSNVSLQNGGWPGLPKTGRGPTRSVRCWRKKA